MTWALWLTAALGGAMAVTFILGRRNVPGDLEEWCGKLSEDASRLRAALELQVTADGAMVSDALERAAKARDSLAYGEAVRLVDIAYRVLESAGADRLERLRGMAQCIRMASAAAVPVAPLAPGSYRLGEIRSLFSAGLIVHHVLVSAAERLLLKLLLLRFGVRLAVRAMKGGADRLHVDPAAVRAWERCEAAVTDWTEGLDPEHVEAFRTVLATAQAAHQRRAA